LTGDLPKDLEINKGKAEGYKIYYIYTHIKAQGYGIKTENPSWQVLTQKH
jgi:hypothetical protein